VKVAVTGGTGFIGRHLIARHVARGDDVRYLTRGQSSIQLPGANAFVGDLVSSVDDMRKFVRGIDVLYHCAAELKNEAEMENTNVRGTGNLLAAATNEVGRWVQLSSTGVYGTNPNRPVDEDSALNPANTYERTKSKSDELVRNAANERGLPCLLLRPSNVYGTDMPNQSLFQLIRMIDKGMFFFVGARGASANYIHVDNVVDALLLCALTDLPLRGRAFILSDHRTIEEFVATIAHTLGKKTPTSRLPESLVRALAALAGPIPGIPLTTSRVDALTSRTVYLTDRIQSELGYSNNISMEQGIGELTRSLKHGSD